MNKIALLPGIRNHTDQYLRYIYQKTNHKVLVYSTAPFFKFSELKKKDYKFSPQPFKLMSKIFGMKISSSMKLIDANFYENFLSFNLKRYNPDIIHAYATYGLNTFKDNMNKLKILDRSCPHILTQIKNLSDEYEKYNLLYSKPNKKNIDKQIEEYELCDKIIVQSSMTKKSFLEHGIDEKKIEVVPISTNKKFKYIYKEFNKEKIIFGFCGGALIRKGLLYLIDAWLRTSEQKNRELWLRSDLKSIKSIPTIYKSIKKRSDIKILDYVKDLNLFFNSLDVLIHPAAEEGFGMTIIEAIKCGVPVILSKNVGALDVINHEHVILLKENYSDGIHDLILKDSDFFKKISIKIKNSEDIKSENDYSIDLSRIYSI